jgi:hypothetical protein
MWVLVDFSSRVSARKIRSENVTEQGHTRGADTYSTVEYSTAQDSVTRTEYIPFPNVMPYRGVAAERTAHGP